MKAKLAGVIGLVLLLIAAFSISACGSDGEETATTASDTETTEAEETTTTASDTETTEAEEFPTEDITWIIPYGPGGGFDTYSRGVARYMPKYLPEGVSVIPENIEGGGGRRGWNELYRADPDGYTIGFVNVPGAIVTQLLEETEYDLDEMTYIGRVSTGIYGLAVSADSEFDSIEDLQNADREITFGTAGVLSTNGVSTSVAAGVLDIPFRKVDYEDAAAGIVGVIRGDTDVDIHPIATQLPHIERGDLKLLVVFDDERNELIPDTPTIAELGYDELAVLGIHRIVAAPPGLPDDRREILEDALMQTLEDEEMIAWSEEVDRPLAPLPGDEAWADAKAAAEIFDEYRDLLEEQ